MTADGMPPLARGVVAGDLRSLARVCRLVDDAVGGYRAILKSLFPHTGRAWTMGITGTPGTGKSTLTDKLIGLLRRRGMRVGVIAVDPSSPFSGGAILGDRIRMQRHHADPEVFIRSVATRGALGGLSRSTADLTWVLDGWGADAVVVETVGVGQDELEVTRTVDSTVVVMSPGMGDEVQAMKAGILECADVFAVNKADREGADATAQQLELMLALGADQDLLGLSRGHHSGATLSPGLPSGPLPDSALSAQETDGQASAAQAWRPPIVRCVATEGRGVEDLLEGLDEHRAWLTSTATGQQRRRQRLADALRQRLRNALLAAAVDQIGPELGQVVTAVAAREIDPYTATERLVAELQQARGSQ